MPARRRDLYGYGKRLERAVERIAARADLPDGARERILDFHRHCVASGLSPARTLRYLNDLPQLATRLGRPFEDASRTDLERVLEAIERSDYAPQTKLDFRKTVKKFYKWQNGGEAYPDCASWIKTTGKRNHDRLPEDLLTEDDVKRLVAAATHPRDRALIAVLWESGCRVGELLPMGVRNVAFETEVTRITIEGKTGARRVPLIDATPYLAEWIDHHPLRDRPTSWLWVGVGTVGRDEPLEYAALRKMLRSVARKAGVKKGVNPHSFRHGRATVLANHLTEAQMNQYLGWVPGSGMPAVYVHLSGRDVDDAILEMRGRKPRETAPESTMAPKTCARCGTSNKATGRYCARCGAALDLATAVGAQDRMRDLDAKFSRLLRDKTVQEFLVKRMTDLGIA
ncbi:MAG TPA: tyrosine-type recombinase/integrase [Thermoplasmata archaeon]|nr:tyrosine-type recombinase/integrase [Thermoplasmata archaeon]